MRESDIQKQCLDYLKILENQGKCYCVRTASGAVKTDTGRYFRTGRAGTPDIICCIKGKFTGFEIKNEKGKLSPAQKQAEESITQTGGEYYIIRSLDELTKIL